jgi:tetraprenyl-beta-curcumene synthase
MPISRREIHHWTTLASAIPTEELRQQALDSLQDKRFHADGGCVYAAAEPTATPDLVRLIVALQTISDYLDNLCDRCHVFDAQDFHQLHHAMRDAVCPEAPLRNYYEHRTLKDGSSVNDGGYLDSLVLTCQATIRHLPGYSAVQAHVVWLVERYCELQEHKHIDPALRRATLENWCKPYLAEFPDLHWWEFAAATGSTLGMFSLFLAATKPVSQETADTIYKSYFPWVCGLHILLDYLIDLEEDKLEGDFNFVRCYETPKLARQRIRLFAWNSWDMAKRVQSTGRIHRFVVQGLLGMYLSDAKAASQRQVRRVRRLLFYFGPTAWMFYWACVVYRIVR